MTSKVCELKFERPNKLHQWPDQENFPGLRLFFGIRLPCYDPAGLLKTKVLHIMFLLLLEFRILCNSVCSDGAHLRLLTLPFRHTALVEIGFKT